MCVYYIIYNDIDIQNVHRFDEIQKKNEKILQLPSSSFGSIYSNSMYIVYIHTTPKVLFPNQTFLIMRWHNKLLYTHTYTNTYTILSYIFSFEYDS